MAARTVSTAAGTIIGPTIAKIDQVLSQRSSRCMFSLGDLDRLLDARLELMAEAGVRPGGPPVP